jgi:lipopolysaccharide transport system permease protein
LFTFVMGNFFRTPMKSYAPFIYSGLIFWELMVSSVNAGCASFINAEGYIKQFSHPLIIYTLRCVIPCMVNFSCAFVGLVIWVLCWKFSNLNATWLSLLISFPLLFLFIWPIVTICGFIGTKFRDFSQLIMIALQALYYVSPILFLPQMFISAHMGFLLDYNPLYHLLNLFRAPLLEGVLPAANDFIFVGVTIVMLSLWAWYLIRRNQHTIIFYL